MKQVFAALALMATPALAEVPSATSATYGDWVMNCKADAAGKQGCEILTQLSVKGKDGQLRPFLSMLVGTVAGAEVLRLQLPTEVDLRAGVRLDPAVEGEATPADPPADPPLAAPVYVTCAPTGCLAEAPMTEALLGQLQKAKAVDLRVVAWNGGRTIRVPVTLKGFSDAHAAMLAATK